jgi:hypothetical protein
LNAFLDANVIFLDANVIVLDATVVITAVLHIRRDTIDPDEPINISYLLAFDLTQGGLQSRCVNDFACQNM